MKLFAHSVEDQPESQWEPLAHHLSAVGSKAAGFASVFGAERTAQAMGLLHDIGKCSAAYQAYIRRPRAKNGRKGPDHSSAGAQEACRIYGQLGRLMAFGLAGHHAGLTDGSGLQGSALPQRLTKTIEDYSGWEAHVEGLPSMADIVKGLRLPDPNAIGQGFEKAFFIRMLFSALVDADRLETEIFCTKAAGDALPMRGGEISASHLDAIRRFMAKHRRNDTPVNRLRSEILDHANAKAALPPGLFTLTVPTGGGKTLTSLSFALEHALQHGLRRIVYVIPFTSIIEQTAAVFRDNVGLGDAVLEHHSNFDWDEKPPASDDIEGEGAAGIAKLRRDSENWDAPIIVTTSVQFFESLFAARTSRARKLHNLANSVIILDEVQSLPVKLLRPCLAAIDELARNYGASIVLCTATQPALRQQDGALPKDSGLDIPDERELAPDPRRLYQQLQRVQVEWKREPVADADIAARFAETPQMLCIVNSRAHARDLFQQIADQPGAVHLTTLLCARHRREVLAGLRADLREGSPVRLVATSLIEAGVDIDFPEVWRAAAGLHNVAQAAGRCNREGKLPGLGRTVLFEAADHKTPPMVEAFYGPARNALRKHDGGDVLGLPAIEDYYRELYWRQGEEALDKASLGGEDYPILPAIQNTVRKLEFPFAKIASAFRMIDNVMEPVIIPWDEEARAAINAIEHADFPPAGTQRKLQAYVVPVPARVRADMLALGAVQAIRPDDYGDRFVVLANEELYDENLGLRLDDPAWRSSENNIF